MPNANLLIGQTPITAARAPLPCTDPQGCCQLGNGKLGVTGAKCSQLCDPLLPSALSSHGLKLCWFRAVLGKTCPGSLPLDEILVIPLHLLIQLFSCFPGNKTKKQIPFLCLSTCLAPHRGQSSIWLLVYFFFKPLELYVRIYKS